MVVVAVANLALSIALTPELGLEGPAVATALPLFVAFPFMLRVGLRASGASLSQLAERAWAPNYLLGGVLAVGLVALRIVVDAPLAEVVSGGAALLIYWTLFYRFVLGESERTLVRGLVTRRG
jgi:hypothetical protein